MLVGVQCPFEHLNELEAVTFGKTSPDSGLKALASRKPAGGLAVVYPDHS